jgi:tricorn protease-like protein
MKIKHIVLGFAVAGLLFTSCNPNKLKNQEVLQAGMISMDQDEDIIGNYGAEITTEGAISASQVLGKLADQESVDLKVQGKIVEVCQMKGCWMTMDIGSGKTMRITFKDYGFFVPKASSGYNAVMEGKLSKKMMDVETLKHYAEDEGKTEEEIAAITEPEESLNFEAVGVVITGLSD